MHLQIRQAHIGYNTTLISNATADLKLGDVCLLIGNNGVGKTTLIKSILHQTPLLQGEISINGKNIKRLSVKEVAENIAIVFSKSVIPQHYTVEDLISLGKYIYYSFYFELKKEDREEVAHIIEELDLSQYRYTLLKNLSDGNLQKAFIGRAITQNSPIIILDEPTTHLDEKNKIIILKTLRRLAKEQNKIILFSSHDWRLAKEFADKIWYVKDKQLYTGIVEDLLLQHEELTNPSLFEVNEKFIPPHISAPPVHKEMLYSLLQKNFQKDLSSFNFEFKDTFWEITNNSAEYQCESFEEIIILIENI
ncbi:ABC transporter ATP-binding protein [Chryseobacterium indologenes]|uniref:ABC transporter ATP-binding protein n=1 Tax=Chryseobacterium indologenes TaxID=253 RepID=UPI000F5178CE|nr:ABC transporter ATP-binding protein [Chryseobacterium indologenes]AYZ35923.1 ABC transporter ATP-binding protein [Chryseobacterium indologenes]MBF6644706.1 ABC transporter ATP-binding protein [Chryseobacterium indologenes]MBU3048245.1 ABC transporter ATP-binding protein [Chryseobacterium indologenes]MEB4759700.1 ABC transporter ATP-binding protein [Chryseobacterium indologenes]QQQ71601.1 ABC transporter ATP-binding protein [Chryseobacterium indologenes]